MTDIEPVLDDLATVSAQVDDMVAPPHDVTWRRDTPAVGWTIAHQIAHLAWTDQQSLLALREPEEFSTQVRKAMTTDSFVDAGAAAGAGKEPGTLLVDWRAGRAELANALRGLSAGTKVPWFGPPMSPPSMVSARLMETWAHGQDIADALGVRFEPGPALWQIARFGVRTRDFAFAVHSLEPPSAAVHVVLTGPAGQRWTFGPHDAAEQVSGSALDFCLLVTQRRHRDDTELRAVGDHAKTWLSIAQAFAGPPGNGRKAGQFDD